MELCAAQTRFSVRRLEHCTEAVQQTEHTMYQCILMLILVAYLMFCCGTIRCLSAFMHNYRSVRAPVMFPCQYNPLSNPSWNTCSIHSPWASQVTTGFELLQTFTVLLFVGCDDAVVFVFGQFDLCLPSYLYLMWQLKCKATWMSHKYAASSYNRNGVNIIFVCKGLTRGVFGENAKLKFWAKCSFFFQ